MFFVISKVAGFFVVPSNAIALLGLLGVVLLAMRRRHAATALLVASSLLLGIAGFTPLGTVLLLSLSERFPPWQPHGGDPDGIIVLGGAINSEVSVARNDVEVDSSAERVIEMLRLARRYPNARIVFTGDSGNLLPPVVPEAPIAGRLLEEFGVSPDRIQLEPRARSTAENAAFLRGHLVIKSGERWLLLTSAFHMPRAIGVFRKAGFDLEAYPVDWRTRGWVDAAWPFDRLSAGLERTDLAAHEWSGLLAYWLGGKSSALFPRP